MKAVMNLCVVNFKPTWADKEDNLARMVDYAACAAKQGADMIVFPEMALTGYDDEPEKPIAEKMQVKLAEPIPGPATQMLGTIAKQYGCTIVFGMPQTTPEGVEKVYNAAAILQPDGTALAYQKMHLPGAENNWATPGETPMVFDTAWGPVGLGICYDAYCFPELSRYACAKGARLFLNPTACCHEAVIPEMTQRQSEAYVYMNPVYIANANLVGEDKVSHFYGGSSIVGMDADNKKIVYYAGYPFGDPEGELPVMYMATIDLSILNRKTDIPLYETNPRTGKPDWRPEIYKAMMQDILADPAWQAKTKK